MDSGRSSCLRRRYKSHCKGHGGTARSESKAFRHSGISRGKDVGEARGDGIVRNLGKGPALNIEYTTPKSATPPTRWPSVLADDGSDIIRFSTIMPVRWQPMNGFILEYDSLSGRRYRSTVGMGNLWAMETVLEEVSPLSARPKPVLVF